MNQHHFKVGLLIALGLVTFLGAGLILGGLPWVDDDPETTPTPSPVTPDGDGEVTPTPSPVTPDDGNDATPTPEPNGDEAEQDPYSFSVDNIDDCSQTCRDVTVTLTNNLESTGSNITVHTEIFAGVNNTDSDDKVWEGTREIDQLEAEESYTATQRVEVSFWDAMLIQQRDGWITIHTTLATDHRTMTFVEYRQVG